MPLNTLQAEQAPQPILLQTATPAAPVRFEALTGFRCLAACLVFVYHNRKYWRDHLHPEITRLLNELHIGVSLFFVLSGFLIAYTYGEQPLQSPRSYGRYILLRMARILPLYWVILTCYYADKPYGQHGFTWLTYTLVHAFSNQHNLEGIAQAWSLNVELVFYLLAPFLCLLRRKHLLCLLGALATLFITAWGLGYGWFLINGNKQQFFYPVDFLLHSTFFGRSTEFAAGLLLAAAWKRSKGTFLQMLPHKTLIGFTGMLLCCYLLRLFQPDMFHHGNDRLSGHLFMILVLPIFTVISFTGLMTERTWVQRFFASRAMVLLGNASFAFYLVHISYVNMKIKSYLLLPDRNFLLLWGVSIILYLVVEKNIYSICRRLLKPTAPNIKVHSTQHVH